jgi:hypothetical protein
MTWRQVHEIIRTLSAAGNVRLVGADVMEFTPVYPSGHRDGVMTAMVGWELLCWLARVVAERNGEWRRTRWALADKCQGKLCHLIRRYPADGGARPSASGVGAFTRACGLRRSNPP